MNPLSRVCILVRTDLQDGMPITPTFLGTVFAYSSPRIFVTAAHCVKDHPTDQFLGVFSLKARKIQPVALVVTHESADVAAVVVEGPLRFEAEPFTGIAPASEWTLGADFCAFGFPEDVLPAKPRPTPRLFRGHFQRYFHHTSGAGYSYVAGELSVPSPPGLSGGPVFNPNAPSVLYGVAAENFDSTTLRDSVEESPTSRTTFVRVISYGLCVMLDEFQDWLEEVVREHGSKA